MDTQSRITYHWRFGMKTQKLLELNRIQVVVIQLRKKGEQDGREEFMPLVRIRL